MHKRLSTGAVLIVTLAFMLGASAAAKWHTRTPAVNAVYPAVMTEGSSLYTLSEGRLLININAADVQTLMLLEGIGETLAQRIVDDRAENGAFSSVEDLMRVSGIGEGKLNAIRDDICCE